MVLAAAWPSYSILCSETIWNRLIASRFLWQFGPARCTGRDMVRTDRGLQVTLHNATLKPSALDRLGLPVRVRRGVVGKIKLCVPWNKLRSEPMVCRCPARSRLLMFAAAFGTRRHRAASWPPPAHCRGAAHSQGSARVMHRARAAACGRWTGCQGLRHSSIRTQTVGHWRAARATGAGWW